VVAVHVAGELRVVTSRRLLARLGYLRTTRGDDATLPGESNQYIALRYACPDHPKESVRWQVFADGRTPAVCKSCGDELVPVT
jgi:hypothetical protein